MRVARTAYRRPEIQYRPIAFPRVRRGLNDGESERLESFVEAVVRLPIPSENAPNHSNEVGIDHRLGFAGRHDANRAADVLPHSRQIPIEGMSGGSLTRHFMKRMGSALLKSQGSERRIEFSDRCCRKRIPVRIASKELEDKSSDCTGSGSLEENLRNRNTVLVCPAPPRKISSLVLKPFHQQRPDCTRRSLLEPVSGPAGRAR